MLVLVGVYQFNTNDIGMSSCCHFRNVRVAEFVYVLLFSVLVGLTELIARVWHA